MSYWNQFKPWLLCFWSGTGVPKYLVPCPLCGRLTLSPGFWLQPRAFQEEAIWTCSFLPSLNTLCPSSKVKNKTTTMQSCYKKEISPLPVIQDTTDPGSAELSPPTSSQVAFHLEEGCTCHCQAWPEQPCFLLWCHCFPSLEGLFSVSDCLLSLPEPTNFNSVITLS